eukprot:4891637-Pleurochrysis_carterae.AAC.1
MLVVDLYRVEAAFLQVCHQVVFAFCPAAQVDHVGHVGFGEKVRCDDCRSSPSSPCKSFGD